MEKVERPDINCAARQIDARRSTRFNNHLIKAVLFS
jgi:hypothetical protein